MVYTVAESRDGEGTDTEGKSKTWNSINGYPTFCSNNNLGRAALNCQRRIKKKWGNPDCLCSKRAKLADYVCAVVFFRV